RPRRRARRRRRRRAPSMAETLAFVAPWFGRDIAGGAEAECRATARALQARGVPVEILTTCVRDHASEWVDHHPAGTTDEDALVAPERSLLVPCLHDEPFAYLRWTLRILRTARRVCFHVAAEQALGEALAGPSPERFALVGEGVDVPPAGDGARFREKYRVEG